MAQNGQCLIDAIKRLGVNLMGFFGGGCTTQMGTLNAPTIVRCLLLAATMPCMGEGIQISSAEPLQKLRTAITQENHKNAFISTFFTASSLLCSLSPEGWKFEVRGVDSLVTCFLTPDGILCL